MVSKDWGQEQMAEPTRKKHSGCSDTVTMVGVKCMPLTASLCPEKSIYRDQITKASWSKGR